MEIDKVAQREECIGKIIDEDGWIGFSIDPSSVRFWPLYNSSGDVISYRRGINVVSLSERDSRGFRIKYYIKE